MLPLGELCDVLDHKRKPVTKSDRVAGPYPYYGATGIQDYVADFLFDEPLVLVGEDGAKWESGDNTAFAVEGKVWVNNHAHVLRPHRGRILDNWLINYLNHSDLTEYVSGVTVPKLNQGNLREIPIPVPPLPQQQRIVGILDEAFAGIAIAKANAEKNLRNARALFENYLYTTFARFGERWPRQHLVELCQSDRVITYGVIKLGHEVSNGVPCLRTSNVRWLSIDTDGMKRIAKSLSDEFGRTILQGGEVLVNVRGTLGGVCVVASEMAGWNVSREVAMVPCDAMRIDPYYLAYWIGTHESQSWLGGVKKGAAYVGINIEDLRLLPIPLPSLSEQRSLAAQLDRVRVECRRLEGLYEKKLAALDALKKSLLHEAFSGRLGVKI